MAATLYRIEVEVKKGRNLVAKDRALLGMGPRTTSDPYVELYFGTRKIGTSETIEKNLNPPWENAKFDWIVGWPTLNRKRSVEVRIWDKDVVSSDDPMGNVFISFPDIPFHFEKWLPVNVGVGNYKCPNATGELLVEIRIRGVSLDGDSSKNSVVTMESIKEEEDDEEMNGNTTASRPQHLQMQPPDDRHRAKKTKNMADPETTDAKERDREIKKKKKKENRVHDEQDTIEKMGSKEERSERKSHRHHDNRQKKESREHRKDRVSHGHDAIDKKHSREGRREKTSSKSHRSASPGLSSRSPVRTRSPTRSKSPRTYDGGLASGVKKLALTDF